MAIVAIREKTPGKTLRPITYWFTKQDGTTDDKKYSLPAGGKVLILEAIQGVGLHSSLYGVMTLRHEDTNVKAASDVQKKRKAEHDSAVQKFNGATPETKAVLEEAVKKAAKALSDAEAQLTEASSAAVVEVLHGYQEKKVPAEGKKGASVKSDVAK